MENLKIGTDTTGKSITEKSLTMIGTGMTLVGAILLAYSVIQYIMAFIHSTPDESANASKGLAVGVAFSAGGGIMKGLKTILTSNNSSTATIVKYVVYEVIAKAATYVGVGMLLYGVVTYLLAFRDESAEGKNEIKYLFCSRTWTNFSNGNYKQSHRTWILQIEIFSFWSLSICTPLCGPLDMSREDT